MPMYQTLYDNAVLSLNDLKLGLSEIRINLDLNTFTFSTVDELTHGVSNYAITQSLVNVSASDEIAHFQKLMKLSKVSNGCHDTMTRYFNNHELHTWENDYTRHYMYLLDRIVFHLTTFTLSDRTRSDNHKQNNEIRDSAAPRSDAYKREKLTRFNNRYENQSYNFGAIYDLF